MDLREMTGQEMAAFAFLCCFDVLGRRESDPNAKQVSATIRLETPRAYRLAVRRLASLHPQSETEH
ncbi:hypothetical protein EN851_03545 [Mesorhizobium sp. M8A.F.Ca.ET.208.01.1.1]|uniref:hypothetical protein n=1 Tax=unclassified Mesorhizobium TaxID=325217 RepID=UPI00109368B0|nr:MULTISPECIES: hypothetical protein [unclassified Mesorhizobium]TGQ94639.1 hypothetical protein EN851_03545 [Mesorhizobium sp. M8A.F.Ca.ET.208.01.1.1]TGT55126.1 hypothetical protein EN810_03545 [Mesorhizobium sp. M8A.F.Ca.ET.167.01.1.1]